MPEPSPREDDVARAVIEAAYAVHAALGPGLYRSVYEQCLFQELSSRGREARRQVAVPLTYGGTRVDVGFRIDLLVDDLALVEVRAVEKTSPLHEAQLRTYLRLSGLGVGILINFNVRLLKNGVHRIIAPT